MPVSLRGLTQPDPLPCIRMACKTPHELVQVPLPIAGYPATRARYWLIEGMMIGRCQGGAAFVHLVSPVVEKPLFARLEADNDRMAARLGVR